MENKIIIQAEMKSIDGILFTINTDSSLLEGEKYFEPNHQTVFTVLRGGALMMADTNPGWGAAPKTFLELLDVCYHKNLRQAGNGTRCLDCGEYFS